VKNTWELNNEKGVLNMGLWIENPDLDVVTILYHEGLDGRCRINIKDLKREKVVVDKGTYFAVCNMNTSFVSEIIVLFINYI